MKRIMLIIAIICMIPNIVFAQSLEDFNENEYNNVLDSFDLSSFENALDKNTKSILSDLNIDDFNFEMITNLKLSDFLNILNKIILEKAKSPIESGLEILAFILLSVFVQSFKSTANSSLTSFYSSVTGIILVILLVSKLSITFSLAQATIKLASDFIFAFIPIFIIIVASSGCVVASLADNALLFGLAQTLSFISSNLLLPLVNSFLGIGICCSLNSELNLTSIVRNIKIGITKIISILSGLFVSILSIKTAVAGRADALGLRSMRFAINSVVPVIGSAISEGLLSIQSYSSLIKTTVGVVAIIAIGFVFLPSIIEVIIWRFILGICEITSSVFEESSITSVVKVFKDTLLILNVILILSMVTTIISFGLLIAAKTV